MRNEHKLLNLAVSKIKRTHTTSELWYGYLTPMEYLVLIKYGAIPANSLYEKIEYVLELKRKGDGSSRYFHFKLGKLKNLLPESIINTKRHDAGLV